MWRNNLIALEKSGLGFLLFSEAAENKKRRDDCHEEKK